VRVSPVARGYKPLVTGKNPKTKPREFRPSPSSSWQPSLAYHAGTSGQRKRIFIRYRDLPGEGTYYTAREHAPHRRMCRGTLGTAIACKSWSRDWGPSRGPGYTKHECSQEGGSGPSSLRTRCAGGARYSGRTPASRSPFCQSSGGREGVVQLVEGGKASRCMDVAVLGGLETHT
jgi:hypothetical protein